MVIKKGLQITVGAQIANIVSNSSLGEAIYDSIGTSYNLEHFVNGSTQIGALAGLTAVSYGVTKKALEKCLPFTDEKTQKATSLTAATAFGYTLASTDLFQNALYNITSYDRQVMDFVEAVTLGGIGLGVIAAGALFTKDVYEITVDTIKGWMA